MALVNKDAATIAKKWSTRASGASGDYATGVQTTQKSQTGAAIAAKQVWAQAVAEAAANDSFAKGLQKATDAKWQAGASGKGAQRYGPGVTAGVQNYTTGIGPVIAALNSVQLPPRNVKGNNMARVQVVVDALRKLKTM